VADLVDGAAGAGVPSVSMLGCASGEGDPDDVLPIIGTVHALQGMERDYIIISFVRSVTEEEVATGRSVGLPRELESQSEGLPMQHEQLFKHIMRRMLRSSLGFLNNKRILNVALSRAKRGLLVFGNLEVLSSELIYERLIHHYRSLKCQISTEQFKQLMEGTINPHATPPPPSGLPAADDIGMDVTEEDRIRQLDILRSIRAGGGREDASPTHSSPAAAAAGAPAAAAAAASGGGGVADVDALSLWDDDASPRANDDLLSGSEYEGSDDEDSFDQYEQREVFKQQYFFGGGKKHQQQQQQPSVFTKFAKELHNGTTAADNEPDSPPVAPRAPPPAAAAAAASPQTPNVPVSMGRRPSGLTPGSPPSGGSGRRSGSGQSSARRAVGPSMSIDELKMLAAQRAEGTIATATMERQASSPLNNLPSTTHQLPPLPPPSGQTGGGRSTSAPLTSPALNGPPAVDDQQAPPQGTTPAGAAAESEQASSSQSIPNRRPPSVPDVPAGRGIFATGHVAHRQQQPPDGLQSNGVATAVNGDHPPLAPRSNGTNNGRGGGGGGEVVGACRMCQEPIEVDLSGGIRQEDLSFIELRLCLQHFAALKKQFIEMEQFWRAKFGNQPEIGIVFGVICSQSYQARLSDILREYGDEWGKVIVEFVAHKGVNFELTDAQGRRPFEAAVLDFQTAAIRCLYSLCDTNSAFFMEHLDQIDTALAVERLDWNPHTSPTAQTHTERSEQSNGVN